MCAILYKGTGVEGGEWREANREIGSKEEASLSFPGAGMVEESRKGSLPCKPAGDSEESRRVGLVKGA